MRCIRIARARGVHVHIDDFIKRTLFRFILTRSGKYLLALYKVDSLYAEHRERDGISMIGPDNGSYAGYAPTIKPLNQEIE